MIQARRLGYAVCSTASLEGQVKYYTNVLGLVASQKSANSVVLSTRTGFNCLVLEQGSGPELTGLSFQIDPAISLDTAQSALSRIGISSNIRPGKSRNVGNVLCFKDPRNVEIELFNEFSFAEPDRSDAGAGILKLGHVACFTPDVATVTNFYKDTLGFRASDWRGDIAMFLRCGPDHHTVNFFKRDIEKLGHLAFEVKDFPELVRASDLLARNGYRLDWGPARHVIGHNCACYHSNGDTRIELYAEMDQMKDEALGYFEPRPWHEDRPQRPRNWTLENSPRNQWSGEP